MAQASASASVSPAPPLAPSLRLKLSLMMFLQYAIWGAWLPLFYAFLTEYRGFTGEQTGWLFGIAAMGALVALFVAGQIADRYLATEKFLGISHLLGAALVWQLARLTTFTELLVFGLVYSIIYSPTLPLTNALAFANIPDRDRDFPTIRVWGTIGWIAVGIGMGQWLATHHTPSPDAAIEQLVQRNIIDVEGRKDTARLEKIVEPSRLDEVRRAIAALNEKSSAAFAGKTTGLFKDEAVAREIRAVQVAGMGDSFRLSAMLGFALGLFCFILPHTPPQKGESPLAFAEAMREVKKNPLLTLFLISFPLGCVHQFYFVHTAGFLDHLNVRSPWIDRIFGFGGGPLTISQIGEIVVLSLMGVIAKRFSRKAILTAGALAYTVRFAILAYLPYPEWVYPASALHGVCYGCFFFLAFVIIDEYTTADVRASAQSLYNLVIIGLGIIVGNIAAGYVAGWAALPEGGLDYRMLFSIPMWVCVACLVALAIFYPSERKTAAAAAH